MHSSNTLWRHLQALAKVLLLYMGALLALSLIATVAAFPWDLDPQADESASQAQANYYKTAYSPGATSKGLPAAGGADAAALSEKEAFYANFARKMALKDKVPETVRAFVDRCGLENKKILDVGAGNGLLQDIVADYTGLDISPTARRYFHKPFVEASATDMRFPSESFDGLWSVWVLEHIPNPEKALMEMRRVVKRDGYLLLYPAFDVSRYAAQGCFVRRTAISTGKGSWSSSRRRPRSFLTRCITIKCGCCVPSGPGWAAARRACILRNSRPTTTSIGWPTATPRPRCRSMSCICGSPRGATPV